MISAFFQTEQRIKVTCERHPAFPREPAVLVRLVKHVSRTVQDDANAMLRPYGLSHAEYNLLMMLFGSPEGTLSASELADAANEKSANITRLTNQLCEKELVQRTSAEDDRRKVMLTLTGAGEALIGNFLPEVCSLLERETRGLSDDEQRQLEVLLKKMLAGRQA
jgi:MarR family transcriptional repressor of emrRAB